MLAASTALLTSGAALPPETPISINQPQLADITITIPVVVPHYPVIILPRPAREREREVTVRFIADGDDWATLYLDGRALFRAFNTRRDYTVTLEPGAYYLEIAGVNHLDMWHSGYLDVGRGDSHLVVIRYGKETGVRVAGDPLVWIPD
jgi:hypothetical protein